tara:strand:- start:131 stop:421 length:291 start_codon:yes stop_codon:yes gene_type:complete
MIDNEIDYFELRNKKIEEIVEGNNMNINKYIKNINKWLVNITQLLTNILTFAIISGLLFGDPFGVISTISNLISGVGEQGLAGFICLAILILYRRK